MHPNLRENFQSMSHYQRVSHSSSQLEITQLMREFDISCRFGRQPRKLSRSPTNRRFLNSSEKVKSLRKNNQEAKTLRHIEAITRKSLKEMDPVNSFYRFELSLKMKDMECFKFSPDNQLSPVHLVFCFLTFFNLIKEFLF